MTDFIWWWSEGNIKIFTKKTEVAEKALRKGMLVMGRKICTNDMRC